MKALTIISLVVLIEAIIEIFLFKISAQLSYKRELKKKKIPFIKSAMQWIIVQVLKIAMLFILYLIFIVLIGINIIKWQN